MMQPTPGTIKVGNNTSATGLSYSVKSPDGLRVFGSGTLQAYDSGQSVDVSDYESFTVFFYPVGSPSGNISVQGVTVGGSEPTNVALNGLS